MAVLGLMQPAGYELEYPDLEYIPYMVTLYRGNIIIVVFPCGFYSIMHLRFILKE